MSFILIALSMMIGPLSRLSERARSAIPWRRELGIHGVLLAVAHTIILAAWVEWDFLSLFGYVIHPQTGLYVMLLHGFGLTNTISIIALVYGIVLALSSSNWFQRILGGVVWKFLQQSAYVLWMLIIVHTAYFLYLNFQDYHKQVPAPNWAQIPFAAIILIVILLQLAAFVKTWKPKKAHRKFSG
jgi:sulfoxide reductase heme-binding subunit YedZ